MPPPTQIRWRQHTNGGRCIYCGTTSVSATHLDECQKYKESIAADEEEASVGLAESTNSNQNNIGENATAITTVPFAATKVAGTPCPMPQTGQHQEVAAAVVEGTPPCFQPPKTPAAVNPLDTSTGNTKVKVTPSTTNPVAPPNKKHKASPQVNEPVFSCLACGKKGCPYENGYTVLMKPTEGREVLEFDPSEPEPSDGQAPSDDVSFDVIKEPLELIVARILRSKGIWAAHKFLGNSRLDLKIQTWMRNLIDVGLVDSNWRPLRQGVKEVLHYKRQRAVASIRAAYFGE